MPTYRLLRDRRLCGITGRRFGQDPPWYDLCLYVANNAKKGKHGGLSRQALVEAATGKTGNNAKQTATVFGNAGDVLKSYDILTFDADTNLAYHLQQIARLPEEAWADAVVYLLDQKCTVKRITDEVRAASFTGRHRAPTLLRYFLPVDSGDQHGTRTGSKALAG